MFALFGSLYEKYERHIFVGFFICGFILDFFTLNKIDQLLDNLILTSYIVIAGFCIIFYQTYKSGRIKRPFLVKLARFSPLVVQFVFGGLISGYLIFYSRSATLVSSWPFLLAILIMFFGNEFLRKRYYKLVFQVGVYFFGLFSYFVFLVPVIWGQMGVSVFILSGFFALIGISIFLILILHFGREILIRRKFGIFFAILLIYTGFNIAYFRGWIPPVPLSLKDIGVYHSITKNSQNDFVLSQEKKSWLNHVPFYLDRFELEDGNQAYLFSSIFAPTRLNTEIIHKWFYFDVGMDRWREVGSVQYRISGGRELGYRGFSVKEVYTGEWKVDVLTTDNRLIGSQKFIVK